jgi:hypothetical protein
MNCLELNWNQRNELLGSELDRRNELLGTDWKQINELLGTELEPKK